ncbi:flavodoxin domain-containing protein [Neobacillus niacini]|uniref:flavodoxin domain-containing protein n=1 Tax=Neobacillus niacini TaxID=86668 RepID=UPI0021CB8FA7|nr:flavodoxin domain-containing protein [Neobacillus niacini]MCM3766903.1 flavodoxin domain-containing protein [Neobacillus niacini]
MTIAIVYASNTGNTEDLVHLLQGLFSEKQIAVSMYPVEEFPISELGRLDAIVVGTYTWGNGNIPDEMLPLYRAFEHYGRKDLVTGVAGTGDSGYPSFCGAVDEFRNMLFVQSNLAATLKIEVRPQGKDLDRCRKFVDLIVERVCKKMFSKLT